jgi:ribosome modulation factor
MKLVRWFAVRLAVYGLVALVAGVLFTLAACQHQQHFPMSPSEAKCTKLPSTSRSTIPAARAPNAYVTGLRNAERAGLLRGSSGHSAEPNPYRRPDFAQAFFDGWQRGEAMLWCDQKSKRKNG